MYGKMISCDHFTLKFRRILEASFQIKNNLTVGINSTKKKKKNLNVLLDIEKSKKNKTSNVLIKTMITSSIFKN